MIFAITTARRGPDTVGTDGGPPPKEDVVYLDSVVQQLLDQGVPKEHIRIFPTDESSPTVDGIPTFWPSAPLSLVENSDRLVATMQDLPWFVQLQDDIRFASGAVPKIINVRKPHDAGLISFYTPRRHGRQAGVSAYPPAELYGTLANMWSSRGAKEFLACKADWVVARRQVASGSGSGRMGVKGWDLMVQHWLRSSTECRAYQHTPCLVQHIGDYSSSGKVVGKRVSPNFRG